MKKAKVVPAGQAHRKQMEKLKTLGCPMAQPDPGKPGHCPGIKLCCPTISTETRLSHVS